MLSTRFSLRSHLANALIAWAILLAFAPRHSGAGARPRKLPTQAFRDIAYVDIADDPDRYRHQLDVYRPQDAERYPVLLLFHGGAWVFGSKDDVGGIFGYSTIGRCLAERGLVVVVANYRLSPAVRHPEHIKDAARAFAWTKANVGKYGGDPRRLFVAGHSAGGHLAALLATDESYLKEVGCRTRDICGVIGMSGVYNVSEFDVNWALADKEGVVRASLNVQPLTQVFGNDPATIERASPIAHVRPGLPPFLLMTGGWDYGAMQRMARDFAHALRKNACQVRAIEVPWRTHESLLFDIPRFSSDRVTTRAIMEFIERHGNSD